MFKVLLTALLLWQVGVAEAHISRAEATLVYSIMAKKSGLRKPPPLRFSNSEQINADASGFGITINKGLLDYVKSIDEIALIIGHELAHIKHGDIWKIDNPKLELAADTEGAKIADAAGYSVCNGLGYRIRRYEDFGNEGGKAHPTNSVRLQNLQHYCGRGGG